MFLHELTNPYTGVGPAIKSKAPDPFDWNWDDWDLAGASTSGYNNVTESFYPQELESETKVA